MMHRKGLPTTKVELGSVESQETRVRRNAQLKAFELVDFQHFITIKQEKKSHDMFFPPGYAAQIPQQQRLSQCSQGLLLKQQLSQLQVVTDGDGWMEMQMQLKLGRCLPVALLPPPHWCPPL